jgi:GNAT superfamily N-acetyltransferase
MITYSHGKIELYKFLTLSFPDLTRNTYWKVNTGKHFLEWVWGEIDDQIVCCAAIFTDGRDRYKMGLFCVHPHDRRSGIGTHFYKYIMFSYKKVKWSTITPEARNFYQRQNARELGSERGRDGKNYVMFSND